MKPVRFLMGTFGALAFLSVPRMITGTLARAASSELSAIQVMQVYSEGMFYGVILLGMALCIYIGTRTVA